MSCGDSKLIKGILSAAVFLAVLFSGCTGFGVSAAPSAQEETVCPEPPEGVEYIRSMESRDANAIEDAIYENSFSGKIQTIRDNLENDPSYVWKALKDINTVICGDSRVMAFESFGFMDGSHIIAEAACSMEAVMDIDKLVAANPKLVVMAFGLNDIGLNHFTPEDFAAAACGYVDLIHAYLPDTYVYVQSTLPPSPEGSKTTFTYELVTAWSDAEIAWYKEHGYRYLDINYLIWDYMWLYAPDGFHFEAGFYQYWAEAILNQYIADLTADREKELEAAR